MKKLLLLSVSVTFLLLLSCAPKNQNLQFDPTWESLEKYKCPEWFRDAKFGIFICWNPLSVPANNDWYPRNMYIEGHSAYNYHLENYGHPSEVGYKDIIDMWKGENFNPDHLVGLFKEAGAKYIVPIATYHGNFDLWNSVHHEWNSVNHGPKADIIGMWKEATRKHELRFGVTTHLARSWSWFQTSHGADTSGPYAGIPYDGNDLEYKDLYFEDHGEHSYTYPVDPPDYWPKEWSDRIKDLVDQHAPDLLYFDGGIPFGEVGREVVDYYYNSNIKNNNGELQAVLNIKNNTALPRGNNRYLGWHGDFRHGVAVEDIERGQMGKIDKIPWQTDDTIGPWFYMKNREYNTPKYIINQLVDIVSKNGNLLLNIPPKADGTLDDRTVELLQEIGEWMKVNGEGIYETRPFIQYADSPDTWDGGHFTRMKEMTATDIRFTTRSSVIYAFTGDLPGDEVIIRSLNNVSYRPFQSVEMLGLEGQLEFVQDSEGLKINMPATFPCKYSVCLKLIPGDD